MPQNRSGRVEWCGQKRNRRESNARGPNRHSSFPKTDTKGIITYANLTFCDVAQYTEAELIGQGQNIVRHPAMPRCVFKLLWEEIARGNEMFAYIINLAKSGDHYWVFAHVTPTFDPKMRITGYHSSRRYPKRAGVDAVIGLYEELCAVEARGPDPKAALAASSAAFDAYLQSKGVAYDEFVLIALRRTVRRSPKLPPATGSAWRFSSGSMRTACTTATGKTWRWCRPPLPASW